MENSEHMPRLFEAIFCPQCDNCISYDEKAKNSIWIDCERCGHKVKGLGASSLNTCLAFSTAALILYVPAMFFPFMTMELYGNRNSSTILSGVQDLAETGAWFIAGIILLASVVVPIIKLLILLYLAKPSGLERAALKTKLYRFIEVIGRWSMLDIFLLAVLVAIMKLGPWTYVEPEIGSVMFALVVIFTMLASSSFDPRLLWKDAYVKKNSE